MAWSDCVGRFVFIMGTSMTFSFRGMYRREMTVRAIVTKIVTRAIKLFALGIVLGSSWGRESGVLLLPAWLVRCHHYPYPPPPSGFFSSCLPAFLTCNYLPFRPRWLVVVSPSGVPDLYLPPFPVSLACGYFPCCTPWLVVLSASLTCS